MNKKFILLNKLVYYLCIVLAILTITLLLIQLGEVIDNGGNCYENYITTN